MQSEDEYPSDYEEKREFDYLQISSASDNYNPLGNVSDTKSSFEYALEQVSTSVAHDTDRIIAFYLANLLNENGLIERNMDSAIEDLIVLYPFCMFCSRWIQQVYLRGIYVVLWDRVNILVFRRTL